MDVYELLKSGVFFGLRIGSKCDEIKRALGTNITCSRIDNFDDDLTVYIDHITEIHCFKNEIINIIIRLNHSDAHQEVIIKSPEYRLNTGASLDDIIGLLSNSHIEWNFYTPHCHGKQLELITEGSATFEFIEFNNRMQLNRIHLSDDILFSDNQII